MTPEELRDTERRARDGEHFLSYEIVRLVAIIEQAWREGDEWKASCSEADVILSRISGALCDASTVVVDPPWQGVKDLVAERDAALNRATNAEEQRDMLHAHIAEACVMLGVDPKGVPADSWTLREACLRVSGDLARVTQERDAAVALAIGAEAEAYERCAKIADDGAAVQLRAADYSHDAYDAGGLDALRELAARIRALKGGGT